MTNIGADFIPEERLRALPFRALGRNVRIHDRVTFVNVENISLGDHVRIDADVTILGTGPVEIGSYIHIGAQSYLAGAGGIRIADFCNLSQAVRLYSSNDDYSGAFMTNPSVPAEFTNVHYGTITLEEHVIIGSGSVVLPDVTLHAGAAVGALSLIKQSLEGWTIYAGCPAKPLRARSRDLLQLEARLREQWQKQ